MAGVSGVLILAKVGGAADRTANGRYILPKCKFLTARMWFEPQITNFAIVLKVGNVPSYADSLRITCRTPDHIYRPCSVRPCVTLPQTKYNIPFRKSHSGSYTSTVVVYNPLNLYLGRSMGLCQERDSHHVYCHICKVTFLRGNLFELPHPPTRFYPYYFGHSAVATQTT